MNFSQNCHRRRTLTCSRGASCRRLAARRIGASTTDQPYAYACVKRCLLQTSESFIVFPLELSSSLLIIIIYTNSHFAKRKRGASCSVTLKNIIFLPLTLPINKVRRALAMLDRFDSYTRFREGNMRFSVGSRFRSCGVNSSCVKHTASFALADLIFTHSIVRFSFLH